MGNVSRLGWILGVAALLGVGCHSTPAAPDTPPAFVDGQWWEYGVTPKGSVRLTVHKAPDGWVVEEGWNLSRGPQKFPVDASLMQDNGCPYGSLGMYGAPMWLPASKRKKGARYTRCVVVREKQDLTLRVQGTTQWRKWNAISATQEMNGVTIHYYYDPDSGILLGVHIKRDLNPKTRGGDPRFSTAVSGMILTGTNTPGLATADRKIDHFD